MGSMTCDIRSYYFGKEMKEIQVPRGGYLEPDRIKHYEEIFGPLYSVKYHGQTVFCI